MKEYKVIKDIPGCKAGTILKRNVHENYNINGKWYDEEYFKAHPDFFEEVKSDVEIYTTENYGGWYSSIKYKGTLLLTTNCYFSDCDAKEAAICKLKDLINEGNKYLEQYEN